jgi:hypothetical protein
MTDSSLVEPLLLPTPLKDYHTNLANHLASLIRQVQITNQTPSASGSTSPTEPPPNIRKDSDSSLASDSKVSSDNTTLTKESSADTPQTSIGTGDAVGPKDIIISPPTDTIHISPSSRIDRNDLTARPDRQPPQFTASYQDHGASSAGPSRRGSHSSRSAYPSPVIIPQRSKNSPTRSEVETREEEHRRAWETQGRKVWKHIPKGFELKLERKSRTGSASSAVPSMSTGLNGAGSGNAVRTDEVFANEGPVDMERQPSNVPTTMESISEVSQPIPAPTSAVDAPMIETTREKGPTLQDRQAQSEADEDVPARGRNRHSITKSQEEYEVYITRRNERFAKRADGLASRVESWWSGVQENWEEACQPSTPPEIATHLPSPVLTSTQLRFLPVGSMPDLFESKGPTLRMPSMTLGPRQKRLHIITDHQNESDVDLLIRLSEINQKHATASTMYSRLTPQQSLSPPLSRSRDPLTDASRVFSMNVTTSMPTPKARSNSTQGTSYM